MGPSNQKMRLSIMLPKENLKTRSSKLWDSLQLLKLTRVKLVTLLTIHTPRAKSIVFMTV